MSRIDSRHWKISTGRHFENGHHNAAKIQHCPISSNYQIWHVGRFDSRIDSRHWKISTGRHFQNDHHNTAQIHYCPISTTFHMWVDYDVPNWFLTSKNSTGHHFQIGHHNTAQIQHCSISTSWIDSQHWKISTGLHFQNNTAKIQHCSISKVAFNLFFKPVVSGWFGRLHNH
jgi:hypothetical protein